ncbi:MAG: LysM peptidoglycan-binding domain-containing protein [Nitrospiraceae bacterium]|nr:LysM peptidoglycan-binding domain-containing protein [Nitrospiraceae bacterium]
MAIYVRKGVRNPAGTLLVTFLLGAAIGFSLGYALFGMKSEQERDRTSVDVAAQSPSPTSAAPIEETVETPEEPVEAKLASLAPARAEEVWPGRHLFLAVNGTSLDADTAKLLGEIRPGGIVLREENIVDAAQTTALIADIKNAVGLGTGLSDPPIIAIDQEGGAINPLGIDPAPSAAQLGRARDVDGARSSGQRYAEEAMARGIGVVLGPVLAVLAPGATVSNMAGRVFGSDQELVAVLGLAQADGIMEAHAIPVAKYYPGIGTPKRIDGVELSVLDAELSKLAELMYPFAAAAEQGIPGILVGQVAVPTLDGQRPGRLAAASPVLVQRVLRQYWRYSGVVLADDVALNPMVEATPNEDAVVASLAAGCDAVLFLDPDRGRVRAAFTAIEDAIDTGLLTREQLLESMRRLDGWYVRLSEAKEPEATPPVEPEPKTIAAVVKTPEAAEAPAPEPQSTPAVPEPEAESVPVEEPVPAVTPDEPEAVAEPDAEQTPAKIEEALPEVAEAASPEPQESAEPAVTKLERVPQPPNTKKIVYEIQPGDSLGRIAVRHGVKQSEIMAWNAMKDTKILYGFNLLIYVPLPEELVPEEAPSEEPAVEEPAAEAPMAAETASEKPVAEEAAAQPPEPAETTSEEPATEEPPAEAVPEEPAVEEPPSEEAPADEPAVEKPPAEAPGALQPAAEEPEPDTAEEPVEAESAVTEPEIAPAEIDDMTETYVVKAGDTAHGIARRYGTTVQKLVELNNLRDPQKVLLGQKLKVPRQP